MRLKGKSIIVTGAAGNLGQAVAHRLADEGASLALFGRHRSALAALAAEVSVPCMIRALDLRNRDEVATAVAEVAAKHGGVDGLAALAGGFDMGKTVHGATPDDWEAMMDTNLGTLLPVLASVAPLMIEGKSGSIVTVGAAAANAGKARMAPYIASKSAVMRSTESAAAELGKHGINVNSVLPSIIDTPQNRKAMPDADPSDWVPPERIAAVIAFLLSDDAAAINGTLIPVTGR